VQARPKALLKVINLKEEMPLVREALSRMGRELRLARQEGVSIVKLVHGYGSTGKGGEIRIAVQKALVERQLRGEVQAVIFGENWRVADETMWALLHKWPELKKDPDLGRENKGITVVVL
jgi:ribosomal protein S9